MLKLRFLTLIPLFFCGLVLCGAEIKLNPQKAVILLPEKASNPVRSAALELQKHFQRITGKEIPIRQGEKTASDSYPFFVGIKPEHDAKPWVREEARWIVTPSGTWIYGEDFTLAKPQSRFNPNDIFAKSTRTGTLFAVYDFLEKQFGVLWLEPGENGIVVPRNALPVLKTGSGAWNPGALVQREIRSGINWKYYKQDEAYFPSEFHLSKAQFDQKYEDVMFWLKRHKMGRGTLMNYGHAFTAWWTKYGKEHPEYFALQEDGTRGLGRGLKPDRSKLCVSNPAVHQKIVEEWLAKGAPEIINVCENDSGGFCRCDACRKLDVQHPGEEFGAHLTDRYVHLANQVQKLAAKHNPKVSAIFYAYSCYREPPRRETVDSRIIIGFVPSMMEYDKVAGMFEAWKKAGAGKIFLRPNDQHANTGLPMGFEKQLFDHFQLGIKNGIIGSDYDTLHNYWPINGIADYILARAHEDPSKSFEHWEKEYCSAFGGASADIMKYYRYWRKEIWEKRILPNRAAIQKRGLYGNFRRGLMWDINKYYTLADFDNTDAILQNALNKAESGEPKQRIGTLIDANHHARLNYLALTSKPEERLKNGRALLNFRIKHKNDLNIFWPTMFEIEKTFGDISGTLLASNLRNFSQYRDIPVQWYFRIDPENQGLKEHWELLSLSQIQKSWQPILVNTNWENQSSSRVPKTLKEQLKNYDGIGWYAQRITVPASWKGKKISLYFGAVDESCWIYLNGKLSGERLFKKSDDWQTPFAVCIDSQIDWSKSVQTVIVRVEDKAGNGGIWKPVYLVTE